MSQPVDEVEVLVVPDFSDFARELKAGIDNALRGVQAEVAAAFSRIEDAAARAGHEVGAEFHQGGEDDPPPIDLMKQAIPAMYYLMECYGLRPTKPSSDSPAGSTDGQTSTPSAGISSTAGASPTESTSPDSPSPTGSI